ncbi:unnamed protein product [Clonostachys chloroleuca]|uniref:Calcineurin-like phosphoesterase domain-containing protein n=1 Tax=Clonostachys chloroleuca TaxID=1926264 RepID=A0AA35Q4H8_9HYPO|nr:unnamed protein product [Clonostachys chloroleuca]
MGLFTTLGLRRSVIWDPPTLLDHLLSSPPTFIAIQLYHLVIFLVGRPVSPPRDKEPIRVVSISDTHDQTVSIPPGDILIHAGDLTDAGTAHDIQLQLDWLKKQPHPVKLVIAGNHDSYFDPRSRKQEDIDQASKLDLDGITYLENSSTVVEINGRKLNIFGAPDIPECGPSSFAFQYAPDESKWMSKVPPNTDILITHCPPAHHRDLDLGCPHLLREVWRIKPRLHVFGHIHWGAGSEPVHYDDFQTAYERILSLPRRGPILDFLPNENWYLYGHFLLVGINKLIWEFLVRAPRPQEAGLMVNAAQMIGNTGKTTSRAVIVDL